MSYENRSTINGKKVNTVDFLQAYQSMCNEDESLDSPMTRRQVFDLLLDRISISDDLDYQVTT